jgi:hypothetical protein
LLRRRFHKIGAAHRDSTDVARRISIVGLVVVLVAIGVARIAATYSVFNQTWDEPGHIATGMEWLDRGSYTYMPQHPPLARVAVALGPFIDGSRSVGEPLKSLAASSQEGNQILHARDTYDSYFRTLTLARIGILPFFLAAAALVWAWSRRLFGDATALAATALFTTLPPILAHAGLATTDMASAATILGAVFAFTLFFERPILRRSVIFGAAAALAVLAKFSAVFLLPVCMVVVAAWRRYLGPEGSPLAATEGGGRVSGLAVAALTAFALVWAGYQFSFGAIFTSDSRPHSGIDRRIDANSSLHGLAYAAVEAPVYPAPEVFHGIGDVINHNDGGHPSFLLGERKVTGWWYFFPGALGVKTPIPFLLLAGIGVAVTVRRGWRSKAWADAAPALCAAAILLTVIPATINIGVRHILPIYPLLAIAAGAGVAALWNAYRRPLLGRSTLVALFAWQIGASILAHPDYLAYFNETVGRHPERVLVDSDLDWGQDIKRLSDTLRSLEVDEVAIAVGGSADLERHNLPEIRRLEPDQPTSGWIAVSFRVLKISEGYSWLEDHEPVMTVGKSIRLYHLPEAE